MQFLCSSFITTVLYFVLAIAILLLMVLIHELGHYVVGRALGFKIKEFSIGFGKAIFSRKNKRGEKISLRILPLGGYCAFEGEDGEEEDTKNKKGKQLENGQPEIIEAKAGIVETPNKKDRDYLLFNEQKPWKRILVYLAGITFNFISAILFSFILLVSTGYDIQRVTEITKPEYSQGVLVGDVIYAVENNDGKLVNVDYVTGNTLPKLLAKFEDGDVFELKVKRNGEMIRVSCTMHSEIVEEETKLSIGFTTESYPLPFWEALGKCFYFTVGLAFMVLKTLWLLITFQIPLNQIGGPLATVSFIATVAQTNIASILLLIPLIAANLAVFNLMPFPALDGSHVVFTTIEAIRKKPINRTVEAYIHFAGLMLLFAFIIVVDIIYFVS